MAMEGSCRVSPSDNDNDLASARSGPRLALWQVRVAQEEISRHLQGRLRLADVAARLQLSVTHFAKAFKNSVGVPPYRWYQQVRIVKSIQLLNDPGKSLAEIAVECGFTDESHYITTFSGIVGITPGRWRRKMREGGADLGNALMRA